MSFIEDLRHERESAASAYFRFCFNCPLNPRGVHAFFEGHDDRSFYTNFLRRFVAEDCMFTYKCGGKKEVYETFRKFKRGSQRGTSLFFVDKDLSDILPESQEEAPEIYVTEYYAIENYLVSEEMLSRIWTELFHFKKGALEFAQFYREKFLTELERFYQFALPIVAWDIYLRRNKQTPNTKNIEFSHFFFLNDDLTLEKTEILQRLGEVQLLEKVCGGRTPHGWSIDLELIAKELSSLSPKMYIKGKLELCFLVRFVEKLLMLLHRYISVDGNGVSMKTNLTEACAVEVLGPRASLPPSLQNFLQRNLMEAS